MQSITDRIATGERILCDGGIGTMLFEAGLEPGACPESVVLDKPALIEDIARQYFEAGAQIVETCTFGGSPLKLAQYGLDDRTAEINGQAVRVVRDVVGGQAYVGGSIGPSGKMLEPYGDVSRDQLHDSYRRQMAPMIDAGVDCIMVETMLDVEEATIAVTAAKEVAADIPVTATMTFDATPRGFYTIMGVDVPTAVERLLASGADIVGSNCGNGVEKMVEIASAFRDVTDNQLIIQSNAGLPETENGKVVYRESPEFMAAHVKQLLDTGVSIIGGCCGTTPEHIRAFRALLDDTTRQS